MNPERNDGQSKAIYIYSRTDHLTIHYHRSKQYHANNTSLSLLFYISPPSTTMKSAVFSVLALATAANAACAPGQWNVADNDALLCDQEQCGVQCLGNAA